MGFWGTSLLGRAKKKSIVAKKPMTGQKSMSFSHQNGLLGAVGMGGAGGVGGSVMMKTVPQTAFTSQSWATSGFSGFPTSGMNISPRPTGGDPAVVFTPISEVSKKELLTNVLKSKMIR